MAHSISTQSSDTTMPNCLPLLPEQCLVGTWSVGQREVVVVKEKEDLFYYTNGNLEQKKIRLQANLFNLYGIRRAISLIKIFHDVIQLNLEDGIDSLAFLPLLCTDGFAPKKIGDKIHYEPTFIQTALFGRRIYRNEKCEAIGVRWGTYNPVGKVVNHFEDTDTEGVAKRFICKVPYKMTREQQLEKEYDRYVKRFKPIITYNDAGQIMSLVLRCFSIYDKNIIFSEQHWGITVISDNTRCGVKTVKASTPLSHAMFACEGLKEGALIWQFAHITIRGARENQRPNEAQVELFKPNEIEENKYTNLTKINKGPTWLIARHLVERMLRSAVAL